MPREGYDTVTIKDAVKKKLHSLAKIEKRSDMQMAEILLLHAIKHWRGTKNGQS